MFAMAKRILIILLVSAFHIDISAKDVLLYSYQAQRVELVNQALVSVLDSIIEYVEHLKTNHSCACLNDSIAYNVSFVKISDWSLDKKIGINIYVDEMQNYLRQDCKYVSYLNRNGKNHRINVNICCEEDIDWIHATSSIFFIITGNIIQKKYKRTYSEKEIQEMYEQGCVGEEDGGSELWFVYEDGLVWYWQGHFCDGNIIFP